MSPAALLIVEDEAIVAMDLSNELQASGYRVIGIARSGEEALRLAREQRPDLALMDIRLQGAMDGIQAAEQLSRELAVPSVFLTSLNDAQTAERAMRAAPYGYLTKPYRIHELRAGIETALAKARLERQLHESERWFAWTLHCVDDGVIATEPDARVRFMNTAAEALTGWTLAEAAGRGIAEVLRFGHEGEGDSLAQRALREGRVIGIEHARVLWRHDGGQLPVDESAAPIDDDQGRRLGAVVVLRDARERIAQEERLRASEARFRSAFDVAPFGMALVSLDGRFIQVNDALCRLLRCDAAWLRSQRHEAVSHEDDVADERARLRELLAKRWPVVQYPKRYRARKGDEPVWALVSASVLREGEEPLCYLLQIDDLSEQRQAAAQLAELAVERLKVSEAEAALQAKDRFLSWISHELRTPLGAVVGFAELMKAHAGDNAVAKDYAEHILRAGEHLVTLVKDVIDLQRAAAGQLHMEIGSVSLADSIDVAEEFLAPLAAQHQVRFERELAAGLAVQVDPLRWRQVLLNLGSNAVKYSQPGGIVRWRARALDDDKVEVSVEDEGRGIAPEALSRLYQPFERLGQERGPIPGTGLGLVITRCLVEAMGGSMNLTSAPGVGTRVDVVLRRA